MHHSALAATPSVSADPAPRAEAQLAVEAAKARAFGKAFVAAVLDSLGRTLCAAPTVARTIETWPGDLASAGVIFRLTAGLHALARSQQFPMLHALYRDAGAATVPDPVQFDLAVTQALVLGEDALLAWLRGPTQTNEVARIAGLAAVLADLSAAQPLPCRILELGSSAGLNLNLAHYAITVGAVELGKTGSAVRIAPRWSGPSPAAGPVMIAGARGVDLCPLDVAHPGDADRLHAYVWPGERARTQRLGAAIALARRHRPRVDAASAAAWLEQQLESPQLAGERRVVFHAMTLQYMPPADRARIDRLLADAGAQASPARPLARVAIEWNAARSDVEVLVTCWDGRPQDGTTTLAARCHPYAEWFDWIGLGRASPTRDEPGN
ncbi:hypothetical protein AQZ52_13930 [Novosphingobium fuchskuhlense]|uniref:DUF2332 domain-containing protein n=1 Tax=Novosphingobium fuchskuhlense TaxID=1117702 RepID=A0A124JU65_9SPHN|nr:DUF2332 family protein [Novosphingobium fuchskuhlense]KUR70909.1 hypothetical protein AQZ52_13930 [Novosphingobium fuchskuhlense]